VRLASEGGFAGAVLDAGCGTGENALHIASLGLKVLALTWQKRRWRLPERKPPSVGSQSSDQRSWDEVDLPRLTLSSWSVWAQV